MLALRIFVSAVLWCAFPAGAAEISQTVVSRLRVLIRAEMETQLKLKSGAQCSEEDLFDGAERKLALLEQTMGLATSTKGDKFNNLITFFKDKMIKKCCELSGRTPKAGFSQGDGGGGGGGGRGRGGGGGQGRGGGGGGRRGGQ